MSGDVRLLLVVRIVAKREAWIAPPPCNDISFERCGQLSKGQFVACEELSTWGLALLAGARYRQTVAAGATGVGAATSTATCDEVPTPRSALEIGKFCHSYSGLEASAGFDVDMG